MCLLAVLFRVRAEEPLVVAANRDELLARPAEPMQVLSSQGPRILGGRDGVAGGTWLAVNEHGVVAGLTNKPTGGQRDPSRRSRRELPLLLAGHETAQQAVEAFARAVDARDYNPCWLLVGDRDALYYIELEGQGTPPVRPLAPGFHVLENRPLEAPSEKVERVRGRLARAASTPAGGLVSTLGDMLREHGDGVAATCVHAGAYGTRSSTIVQVPAGDLRPQVHYADGPPCTHELGDTSLLWGP